jgi:CheY-like chemotaxis protein
MGAEETNASAAHSAPSCPHTVLVVEDEPAVRELVTEVLRDEGYEVAEARDGAEAIRVLEQRRSPTRFCAVVLDMMLPRMDGVSVLRRLRDRGADVPVVAMSASSAHLALAEAAGARTTVAKPFDVDLLLGAVLSSCRHQWRHPSATAHH